MPYAPGIEYRGDQYAFQGIMGGLRSLGGSLEEWSKKRDEINKNLGEANALYEFGHKHGYITPEEDTKFIQANASQKADMAAGWAKRMALEQHAADQAAELDYHNAVLAQQASEGAAARANQLAIANLPARTAAEVPYAGAPIVNPNDPSDIWGIYGRTGNAIMAPRYTAAQAAGLDTGVVSSPLLDADKKPVPGKVVVTKPGSNAFSVQDVTQMPEEVQTDPTGNFKWNTHTRNWDPIPSKTARRMQTGSGLDELTVPPNLTERIEKRIGDYILGPAATPTQTPTPPPPGFPPPPVATTPLPNAAPGATAGQPLDQATAASILAEVGGDPVKARALAKQRGYTF